MDEAIKKMKRGGKAELRVSPDYKPDVDWTIATAPRHRVELLVTIELLHLQNLKESYAKPVFLSHLYMKTIISPRQARDKHRENSKTYRVRRWEVKGAAKLAQCEQLKEKGNAVFKAGEYERAFRRYTTAKTLADSDQDLSAEDKTAAAALKLTLLNK
jgi:hypothetical protein